jgi:cold shock CspA family protein
MTLEAIDCQKCGSPDVVELKTGSYVCQHCEAVFKHVSPVGVASPAGCEIEGCGVPAIGKCSWCARPYCASHEAVLTDRWEEQWSGRRMVIGRYRSWCRACQETELRAKKKAIDDERARVMRLCTTRGWPDPRNWWDLGIPSPEDHWDRTASEIAAYRDKVEKRWAALSIEDILAEWERRGGNRKPPTFRREAGGLMKRRVAGHYLRRPSGADFLIVDGMIGRIVPGPRFVQNDYRSINKVLLVQAVKAHLRPLKKGIVSAWSASAGIGAIRFEDGSATAFTSRSRLAKTTGKDLTEGARVAFESDMGSRGTMAFEVVGI